MPHNRLTEYLAEQQVAQATVPAGFVACQFVPPNPNPQAQVAAQQDLYRQAQEQALRQVSRDRTARAMFSAWN